MATNGQTLEQQLYVVEQILKKRTHRGKEKYLIKWKGCNSSQNTWEPENNLNCPDLLSQFLNKEKKSKQTARKSVSSKKASKNNETSKESEKAEKNGNPKRQRMTQNVGNLDNTQVCNKTNGFEQGLIAEKLVGITEEAGRLIFVVKWENKDELELVPANETRKYVPRMVIDFYESRIIWNNK